MANSAPVDSDCTKRIPSGASEAYSILFMRPTGRGARTFVVYNTNQLVELNVLLGGVGRRAFPRLCVVGVVVYRLD